VSASWTKARELLARLFGEMGREAVPYYQLDAVPLAGHAPVQVDEALQRGDEGAVERLFEAQLKDGAA
jgi:hypothetical protein